jgi:hypothetical protein
MTVLSSAMSDAPEGVGSVGQRSHIVCLVLAAASFLCGVVAAGLQVQAVCRMVAKPRPLAA